MRRDHLIFGLAGNDVLDRQVEEIADDVRVRHAEGEAPLVRRYAETSCGAKSWKCQRRVSARIEASCNGLDIRYVVTNIQRGSAERLYDTLYCERGQAENLIKLHKSQLASDRTSCRSPLANQVRLLLHTAAYWLLLAVRDAISQAAAACPGRVHHAAAAADQDRGPRHRDRDARAYCLRRLTSGGRAVRECPESGGITPPSSLAGWRSRPAETGCRIPRRARRWRPHTGPAASGRRLVETIASAATCSSAG